MSSIRIFVSAALLATSLQVNAQEPSKPAENPKPSVSDESAQRADMRREVDEAAHAINAYSISRRDEALQRARTAMTDMDQRIKRFQADWSKEAQRVNAEARSSREKAVTDVRERREELQARYRIMQESNAQAWSRAKEGFITAYRDLADSLRPKPAKPGAEKDQKSGEEAGRTGSKKEGE